MKENKIIKITAMISYMCFMLLSQVYAINDIVTGSGEIGVRPVDNNAASKILGAFQFIGYAIAIGMLIVVGIRYTMAAADEKASLKSSSVKYIIGAILIAGAFSLAKWIFNLLE